MWRRAIHIEPNFVPALSGLGLALFAKGDLAGSRQMAERALAGGANAWTWCLLGRLRTIEGDLGGALEAFDQALALEPWIPERMFDVAAAHMRMGKWSVGWGLHTVANRGFHDRVAEGVLDPPCPRWNGEPTESLVVLPRLGFGDAIMFARFLPWARKRAKRLIVLARAKEAELFEAYLGHGIIDALVTELKEEVAHKIELYTLPDLAGATLDTLPSAAPVRPQRLSESLKVGIVWSGSDDTVTNILRRVPFEIMLRLAEDPRVRLFSFQTGKRSADIAAAHAQLLVEDLSGKIEWSWKLTADALLQMDVVVAPDCGLAHMAGALGVPTMLMLSCYPDWRWGWNTDTSPWYPSMELFRQEQPLMWDDVIENVQDALTIMHGTVELPEHCEVVCSTVYGRMHVFETDIPRGYSLIETGRAPDDAEIQMLCAGLRNIKNPVVVDAGANFGCFTLAFAHAGATVHAFEPQPKIAQALKRSVAANNLGAKVIVHEKALATREGDDILSFNEPDYSQPADFGCVVFVINHETRVPCVRLDSLGLQRLDLLKIDVEGMEVAVIGGALETIKRHKPIIFVECHNVSTLHLRAHLDALGYSVTRETERDWLCMFTGKKAEAA